MIERYGTFVFRVDRTDRSFGKGVKSFKEGINGVEEDINAASDSKRDSVKDGEKK